MSRAWVLEFAAPNLAVAAGLARQVVPVGQPVPEVSEAGALGYEVASADFGLIMRLRERVVAEGGRCYLTTREPRGNTAANQHP